MYEANPYGNSNSFCKDILRATCSSRNPGCKRTGAGVTQIDNNHGREQALGSEYGIVVSAFDTKVLQRAQSVEANIFQSAIQGRLARPANLRRAPRGIEQQVRVDKFGLHGEVVSSLMVVRVLSGYLIQFLIQSQNVAALPKGSAF